jgi:hypothetical protein
MRLSTHFFARVVEGDGDGAVAAGGEMADCGGTGGSGWVAVVPLDSYRQCGHFGTKHDRIVAVVGWQVAVI